MKYCLVTNSIYGKKPTVSCSTADDTLLITIFVITLSIFIYLAKKVSESPGVSREKVNPDNDEGTNDEQKKQEELVVSDGSPISPRRSSCSVNIEEDSVSTIESVIPTLPQVNSKENPNVEDDDGKQLDIKNESMMLGQSKNDIIASYCLVSDRFFVLNNNNMSSESHSSTEMTDGGDTREENSEEEKGEDDLERVSHVSERPMLHEIPIQKNSSKHEDLVKHFIVTCAEKNLKVTKESTKHKVSKEEERLAVRESLHAISDNNSIGSCSFSLLCMSDDSSQCFEKSKKFSVQKVKNWEVAPRASLTVQKKAVFFRPQKKINSIKNLVVDSENATSQSPNKSRENNQAKVEVSRKIHSSFDIRAKPSNNSTENRQLRCRRQRKSLKNNKDCGIPVELVGSRSLSRIACSENQQNTLIKNVDSQEMKNEHLQSATEEKVMKSDVEKKLLNDIIHLTDKLEDCNKNSVCGKDTLELFNTHQSPTGDNPNKVNETLGTSSNKQPMSLGAFVSSCNLHERKSPVNAPEKFKNEVELLRNKILSKMGECDKLLLKCLSCKEETPNVGNDSLKNLKRKVSESLGELQSEMNEIEEKRKRETMPNSERDSLESFKTCVTLDDGEVDKASRKKNNQEVQDLNKSKIVTTILNSLLEAEAFSSRVEENVYEKRTREDKDQNNFGIDVTSSICKKSMIDENGNSPEINTNQTIEPFSVMNKSKNKFKDKNYSRPPDFSTAPRKLSEQRYFQRIPESVSSEEGRRLEGDEDEKRCKRTTLCKGGCRCNGNN